MVIRISPDWNVNKGKSIAVLTDLKIRISPDWNVNFIMKQKKKHLQVYSNITRLECKYKLVQCKSTDI